MEKQAAIANTKQNNKNINKYTVFTYNCLQINRYYSTSNRIKWHLTINIIDYLKHSIHESVTKAAVLFQAAPRPTQPIVLIILPSEINVMNRRCAESHEHSRSIKRRDDTDSWQTTRRRLQTARRIIQMKRQSNPNSPTFTNTHNLIQFYTKIQRLGKTLQDINTLRRQNVTLL